MPSTVERPHLILALSAGLESKNKGITWLSQQVDSSPSIISKLLNGETKSPNLDLVKRICDLLELSYRDVLYDSPLDHIQSGQPLSVILQRLMDESALNIAELANKVDCSKQYVSKVLKDGKASNNFYEKVASLFGLTMEQILGNEPIDLIDVSEFYFSATQPEGQLYTYPVLSSNFIAVIGDLTIKKDDERFIFFESQIDLAELGYFYKTEQEYFPFYNAECTLSIQYPSTPEEGSHIIAYDILGQNIHIAEFSNGRHFSLEDSNELENTVFRGVIVASS